MREYPCSGSEETPLVTAKGTQVSLSGAGIALTMRIRPVHCQQCTDRHQSWMHPPGKV